MRKRGSVWTLLAVVVVLCVACGCGTTPDQTYQDHVYLLAVPAALPDGIATAPMLEDFEKYLCDVAGGFSRIGQDVGGGLHNKEVQRQTNYYYMVHATGDIGRQLAVEMNKRFKEERPFVIAMPGRWEKMQPAQ